MIPAYVTYTVHTRTQGRLVSCIIKLSKLSGKAVQLVYLVATLCMFCVMVALCPEVLTTLMANCLKINFMVLSIRAPFIGVATLSLELQAGLEMSVVMKGWELPW